MSETDSGGLRSAWKPALAVAGLVACVGGAIYLLPKPGANKQTEARVTNAAVSTPFTPPPPPASRPPQPETNARQQELPPQSGAKPRGRVSGVGYVAPPRPAAAPAAPAAQQPEDTKIAGFTALRAEALSDPQYWILPGVTIPCKIDTPLDNPPDGTPFRATVDWDMQGMVPEVRKTLIPNGSTIVGTIASGVESGQRRIGATMDALYWPSRPGRPTPMIRLNATAGDQMGTAGLPGNAGNTFWSKFASVAAYAVLDTAVQAGGTLAGNAASDALSSGGGRGVFLNMSPITQGARTLSGAEYDRQQQRAAPFNRPAGHPCTVVVRNPLDFRSVKGLIQ